MPDPYAQCIRARYPDLTIEYLRRDETGQYNVVLIADDALVFRFPRFTAGVGRLQAECALLSAIRPRLSLPIPEPRYQNFEPPIPGHAFAGYPLLVGKSLQHETVAAIADTTIAARLSRQLAAFLRELHEVPVAVLPDHVPMAWGFVTPDWRAGCRQLFGRIERLVLSRLDAAARVPLAAELAYFLADDANFAQSPTVIHGDFGPGNILWDRARGEIAAVIDFGAAGLGDPACDIAALLTYGEDFVAAGSAAYPELCALLPRARFYRRTFALQEALYGVEHGDDAAFARGIAPYLGTSEDEVW